MLPEFSVASIEYLLDLAIEAGEAILQIYKTDFAVHIKEDKTPVTEADQIAEKIILLGLEKLDPSIPAVAEESYSKGDRPDISGGIFWLIDALDGTKEFINRRDEFTVNIALIDKGIPVLGIIYAPALSKIYWGNKSGAYCKHGKSLKRAIKTRKPAKDGFTIVTSRSHRDNEEELRKKYMIKEIILAGSSLKFCLIADGEADIYLRYGPTSEWDTAAGHAILSAAGGKVTQIDGLPLVYGKNNILNPHFIASG